MKKQETDSRKALAIFERMLISIVLQMEISDFQKKRQDRRGDRKVPYKYNSQTICFPILISILDQNRKIKV